MKYKAKTKSQSQSGFSLVELLVAAAILAIGILGLAMLQAMAMRASRGSTNMVVASRVAEQIMDQAEIEGRLSWLNITAANRISPSLADLDRFNLKYVNLRNGTFLAEEYNLNGNLVIADAADPADSIPFFQVSTRRVEVPSASGPGSVGQMSDFNIRIDFTDGVDQAGAEIKRRYNLSRRIIHG